MCRHAGNAAGRPRGVALVAPLCGATCVARAAALAAVAARGFGALPLIVAGGEVRHAGSFPDRERLAGILAAARRAAQVFGAQ